MMALTCVIGTGELIGGYSHLVIGLVIMVIIDGFTLRKLIMSDFESEDIQVDLVVKGG